MSPFLNFTEDEGRARVDLAASRRERPRKGASSLQKASPRDLECGRFRLRYRRSYPLLFLALALSLGCSSSSGASSPGKNPDALVDAAKRGDLEHVKRELSGGCSPDSIGAEGNTALMWASARNHLPVVETLLAAGADLEQRDSQMQTALMWTCWWACWNGHLPVVQRLLEKGASGETRDVHGRKAIDLAVQAGDREVCAWLLSRGMAISTNPELNVGREGALLRACRVGSRDKVAFLLELGVDPDAGTSRSRPVVDAAFAGHTEIVAMLLGAGARVDARDEDGDTALMVAALWHRHEVMEKLLDAGAEIEARDEGRHNEGQSTVLMICAKGGGYTPEPGQDRVRALRLLLDRGADVEATDVMGRTALMAAASRDNKSVSGAVVRELIDALVEAKAPIDAMNNEGECALHYAIEAGRRDGVIHLLEKGAYRDPSEGKYHPTPEELARQKGLEDLARLIAE